MENIFADRINDVPKSFIREILKVTVQPDVISFAGGLPNRDFFPVKEIRESCCRVLDESGKDALQYSTTEGYEPLREFVSKRYADKGINISPDEILITNGSQQGLDLMAKSVLNEGENVIIERPGYLGAIQSLSIYKANFKTVDLENDGPCISDVKKAIESNPKLFYAVPNFQNPSGITWSDSKRREVADVLSPSKTVLIEDDPYGELRFIGKPQESMKKYLEKNTVLLGSFSKIFAPSFRLGWIAAPKSIFEKVIVAKQAADLHTNYFSQRVLFDYLRNNDIDKHISTILAVYRKQREAMVNAIKKYFPEEVEFTEPEGGMFLWVKLPRHINSLELFDIAIKDKVAFVPGDPFYPSNPDKFTMRLNFSCVDEATITEGIERLAGAIKSVM
ncbi:MAG TPA: PLP-dependent aminotransferase family protein [Spirochaetota bacterium]|jgi:2-aminoadipate transaminase|nr:PLP-dependent aminotransferase family protein [Spirochaetota bacterium]HQA53051.1 PLP-dependent aminotransferase family protein [Spirochaetota bacterium]